MRTSARGLTARPGKATAPAFFLWPVARRLAALLVLTSLVFLSRAVVLRLFRHTPLGGEYLVGYGLFNLGFLVAGCSEVRR